MKTIKNVLPKAAIIFLIFTLLCGIIYTGVVTSIAPVSYTHLTLPTNSRV